jgi:hypothetical protein
MVMNRLLPWIAVLIMITAAFGTIYAVTQQAQRNDANSPQIQMSQDVATKLDDNANPTVLMTSQVDINKSMAPFTVIYDKNGKPVAGSGFSNQKLPQIDKGVLESSQGKDYNAVTWKPSGDTRIAAVVVEANKYYVLSGRSLKEVEKNESTTLLISAIGWFVTVLLLGGLFALGAQRSDETY